MTTKRGGEVTKHSLKRVQARREEIKIEDKSALKNLKQKFHNIHRLGIIRSPGGIV